MAAPARATTREEFLCEFATRAHEVPNGGVLAMPPVVGVPVATVQQWIEEGKQTAFRLMQFNRATIEAYLASPEARPPTATEQDAYEIEASRHMTRAQWLLVWGGGSIAEAMQQLWVQRRSRRVAADRANPLAVPGSAPRDNPYAGRAIPAQDFRGVDISVGPEGRAPPAFVPPPRHHEVLQALFDEASPIREVGASMDHLAAFRALNPLFQQMPDSMAMYFLDAFNSVAHPGWEGLGAIPVHVGYAVGEILTRPGQPNHHRRVLDHLSHVHRDPIIERLINTAIRNHPPVFEPAPAREQLQAMADEAVAEARRDLPQRNEPVVFMGVDPSGGGGGGDHRRDNPLDDNRGAMDREQVGMVARDPVRHPFNDAAYAGGNDVEENPDEDEGEENAEADAWAEANAHLIGDEEEIPEDAIINLPMEGPFDVVQVVPGVAPNPNPARHREDLQRLLNEWERDVSPAGVEKRKTQLRQHLLGLPTDRDRGESAWRVWESHPDWLGLREALDTCGGGRQSYVSMVTTWLGAATPDRETILSNVGQAVPEDFREEAVHRVLECAKSASLHHWPCLDDTLFVARLLQLLPASDARIRVLCRMFLALLPYVPENTPSMDDLDWDRFYKPLITLVDESDYRCKVMNIIVAVALGAISDRLAHHMANELHPADRPGFAASLQNQRGCIRTALKRQAVSKRLQEEKAAAPKADAPVAIHQQLAQLDALQGALREGASSDEIKSLVGTIRQVVGRISADVDKDRACVVCMHNERRVRFDPCGHMLACHECSAKVGNKCPQCRAPIDAAQSVFM